MKFTIDLPLPEEWEVETELVEVEEGTVTHLECYTPKTSSVYPGSMIDINVGPIPADTTAADEAFANYANMIGFDDEEDEQENPIFEWDFNNKKAYGFEAICDDDYPIRVMCQEVKAGVLMVMSVVAPSDEDLDELLSYVEKKLRIK